MSVLWGGALDSSRLVSRLQQHAIVPFLLFDVLHGESGVRSEELGELLVINSEELGELLVINVDAELFES
jgi:hypothetical protein